MLVGMKDSSVKLLINDLAACQDKKNFCKHQNTLKRARQLLVLNFISASMVGCLISYSYCGRVVVKGELGRLSFLVIWLLGESSQNGIKINYRLAKR